VPTLYVVPTPIGNLEDITLRALRILREVRLIAAEDTRTTRFLLDHFDIATPLTSYHEHNKLTKLDAIFDALAAGDVALVSDAGTPGISDPGYELIGEALRRGLRVEPLPGANALLPALVASGLPTDSFIYLGFLPRRPAALRDLLTSLKAEPRTLVAYDSPHRITDALAAVVEVFGPDRPVSVAREISKKFEEFVRQPAAAALAYFQQAPPRGEITLVIGGAPPAEKWDEAQVRAALAARLNAGEALKAAAKAIAAESGWDKRAVYDLGIER
jgi:16S rRNA (cytidine1402-2'-O)-methyltransferase